MHAETIANVALIKLSYFLQCTVTASFLVADVVYLPFNGPHTPRHNDQFYSINFRFR